jgi:Na+-transporting methylmalonyl-CoA/oxaloacetate decarboxylase gamma subunit
MLAALWFVAGGMAIVFAVLILLLGAVMVLNRLLKPEVEPRSSSPSNPRPKGHGNA